MTPEQEKLKLFMLVKYGNLYNLFWSGTVVTPEENRILEMHFESVTDNVNVKRRNKGRPPGEHTHSTVGNKYAHTTF